MAIQPIDLNALARWLDAAGVEPGSPITEALRLTGGTQNILVRFRKGERDLVLRRPPLNPRPNSSKLILREIRVLRALQGEPVPHPTLVASCHDESILGAVFYVMSAVDGFNPTVSMPAAPASDPAIRRRMGLEIADALAALGAVDHIAAGLADFGKLDAFLSRQVERWASELEGYREFTAWTGHRDIGEISRIGAWLGKHCPATMVPGIIHGDYHIGNVIYDDDGHLVAIVDWEMATLGDPLIDLGRLLLSWPDGARRPYTMRVDPLDGYPTRADLIRRYGDKSGRDLSSLDWFEVLACYKLGIILEGTHARAQAGLADAATGARLHASAVALLDHARRLIA